MKTLFFRALLIVLVISSFVSVSLATYAKDTTLGVVSVLIISATYLFFLEFKKLVENPFFR